MISRRLPVWGICFLAACRPPATPPDVTAFDQLEKTADSLQTASPQIREHSWRQTLQTATARHDTTAIVYARYQLAKAVARTIPDSAEYHIGEALRQLGPDEANDILRFMLYNGAGIVAEQQRKYHQAAWCYNASAAIILNGQAPGTRPLAKVICLLNAGQYNTKQGQHPRAIRQMREALAILHQMPEPSTRHLFRAQSQLFAAMAEDGTPVDSLRHVLQNIRNIAQQTGDTLQLRFSEDHAGLFHTLAFQFDSAIVHYGRVRGFDEAALAAHQPSAPRNLYTTLANLVSLESRAGRLSAARQLTQRMKEIERSFSEMLADDERAIGLKALSDLQFAEKDVQAAQATTTELLQLKDQISRNAGVQSAAELDALYELQAKDRTIRQMDLQAAETGETLAMQRLLLLVAVLGGVLAVSWLVMAYYFQRQKRMREEQAGVLLQQQLLRAQMEPHFIFNTLGALQRFIRFNEQEPAIRYLGHFSRLLRSNLELSRQSYAPLTEEIEALENYLALQQMRFEQAFRYEIVCPDAEGAFIPPMLIQPFVENSILHGIRLMGEQGMVRITVEVNEKCAVVWIEDNGAGMKGTAEEKEHPSLSGTIARERLTMLAREEGIAAGVEILDGNPGTIVRLVLPVRNGS